MKRATKEHYAILQIPQNASLDDIKKAYRKRAFELHPDLNPNNSDANRQFQLLNEAYVILIDQVKFKNEEKAKASEKYKAHAQNETKQNTQSQTQEKQQTQSQQSSTETTHNQSTQSTTKEEKQQRTETHKRTYAKPQQTEEELKRKAQKAYTTESKKAKSTVYTQKKPAQEEKIQTPSQEEVLHDILNDPFARRVYEDIYSSIKNNNIVEEKKEKEKKTKKVQVEWGEKTVDVDLTNGVGGYMKSWMRKQIDDTLEYRLPIVSLFPGARIRLQIAQGLTKDSRSVDITLPRDFVIGKPVKLVGMGKKLGKWQGDLYITFLPILPKE